MNNYASTVDVTGKQPIPGSGMDLRLSYVRCGHKAPRAGGTFAGSVPMRCPACTTQRKAKKETA